MLPKNINTFGVASCLGGSESTCHTAPEQIKYSQFEHILSAQHLSLNWQGVINQKLSVNNRLDELKNINQEIALFTENNVKQSSQFLVISGDHSSAMGTWAGVKNALAKRSPIESIGLIWLDAHLDAHTLNSSLSGNFHGMPVSVLLGLSEPELLHCYPSQDYILAKELLMYGIRSYENSEKKLLDTHHVHHFPFDISASMNKVKNAFLCDCNKLIKNCDVIGISLDLDILDPIDAPAVETAVANGPTKSHLLEILCAIKKQAKNKFIGLEISEFNPVKDKAYKTEKVIFEIIAQMFSAGFV
jgi:arginase